MTVRLYDSLSADLVDLRPINPGQVGLYVCGPTVQSAPHIGHLRSALNYDILIRWLRYRGYRVTFIRNVTDIDDKILANATPEEPWWALAYRVEGEFEAAYARLGILPVTYEPHATAHISEMIALIERLIESGHAYAAEDGSGDVYFAPATFARYGELTRQNLADLSAAGDEPISAAKRSPEDFALWKGHKPGEPADAAWPAPWGPGRPGWHIECSAMATRYLGSQFDIHGGGLDLRFPHHENELAQSRAAGDAFANIWVHNGLVTVNGQKMSKSLGNSVLAEDILASAQPIVVRYLLGAAHYRSTLEFSTDRSLAEAAAAVDRILGFLERADRRLAGTQFDAISGQPVRVPEDFATAMDDDLAVPMALAVLHDEVRSGNSALDNEDLAGVATARGSVLAMLDVLGLNPADFGSGVGAEDEAAFSALDALVRSRLAERDAARRAKDFVRADQIRDELAAVGVEIEDTADGAEWSLNGR